MRRFHVLVLLWVFFISGAAAAAPRVVVSVAPLHSLVSALMQGVGEPVLLFEDGIAGEKELDESQKIRLITADMLVWSGAGLETAMAQALERSPMLEQKLITLSHYVPLLRRAGYTGMDAERRISLDAAFWSDPRLAIMAVRMIAPRLARLDPEHLDVYLDNEIALIRQLNGLEQEITGLMRPYSEISTAALAGVDQYFRHRYLESVTLVADNADALVKVSGRPEQTCGVASDKPRMTSPGPEYYFEAMRHTAHEVVGCMQRLEAHKTVSNQQAALHGES